MFSISCQLKPALRSTKLRGTLRLERVLHALAHDQAQPQRILAGDLEDQLVVYLQEHFRVEAVILDGLVAVDHRELDDVCRGALDRRIDSGALSELAQIAVAAVDVLDITAAAHHRRHIALGARLLDGVVDEGLHQRDSAEK